MASTNFDAANLPIKSITKEEAATKTKTEAEKLLADHLFAREQWLGENGKKIDRNDGNLDDKEISVFLKRIDECGDGDGQISEEDIIRWKNLNNTKNGHNKVGENEKGLKDLSAKEILGAIKSFFGLEEGKNVKTTEEPTLFEQYEQNALKIVQNSVGASNEVEVNFTFNPEGAEQKKETFIRQGLKMANGEINKYDTNHDGKIDNSEFKAQQEAFLKDAFGESEEISDSSEMDYSLMDATNDGVVNEADIKILNETIMKDSPIDFEMMDVVKDGVIDEKDFDLTANKNAKYDELFKIMDLNDDGFLDETEIASQYILADMYDGEQNGKINMESAQAIEPNKEDLKSAQSYILSKEEENK